MDTQIHASGTVPGMRRYLKTEEGGWRPDASSSLLVALREPDEADGASRLLDTLEAAGTVQEAFAERGAFAAPARLGVAREAAAGDLLIELGSVPNMSHPEAYRIEVGDYVRLIAADARAALHGLRTILQLLSSGGGELAHGVIEDEPVVGERALHLDIGRKFYPQEWILARIREMSELKLNTLQLHFSENEGFTFESERHPGVMSEQYLTKAQIREIIEEARRHRITLIPSLDSPGHLGWALRGRPDWLLRGANGEPAAGALDITNPEAVAFVLDLIDEYAELFEGSPYFHIGGDEFIDFGQFAAYPQLGAYARETLGIEGGTEVDAYVAYLNAVAEALEGRGFTVRAWNDGLYREGPEQKVELKTSVQIAYWTKWDRKMAPAQTFLDKGHKLINFNDAYFYYVLGEHAGYKYPTGEKIHDDWHPGLLPRISEEEPQEWQVPYPEELLGCSFSVWCDKPQAQNVEEVAAGLKGPLRAMAEKAWTGERRYADYAAFVQACEAAGLKG
ncbi:beta-N-acetylhexosaminidase [Saccharibacillus alkalitolerans]|uniref:Family 20 glycosylhydrolase n=1 Tax=Saccharibacillus alkalitolerans TaxID=2705290 RepID=A0ABX0F9T8_9BACL|nr:glycoside hydrolase family 20 protein [Saccharibacillus alkalitolerans]NGZ76710.1 family 20 glycosylhydrolase [Saccharibacillus alkalitolerans]